MDNKVGNQYFIAYDIFGYLIPGLVFIGIVAKTNTWWMDNIVKGRCSGKLADTVILMGFAYVVGHVLAAISSYLIERIFLRKYFGYPSEAMFGEKRKWHCFCEFLLSIIQVSQSGYLRPYSSEFQDLVKKRFKDTFAIAPDDTYDLFWLTWSYVTIHNSACFRRAMHFVNLYGFARNISMTFLFASVLPFLPSWNKQLGLPELIWSPVCIAVAIIMFSNYAKLMRRSNSEIYRAFIAMTSPSPKGTTEKASGK